MELGRLRKILISNTVMVNRVNLKVLRSESNKTCSFSQTSELFLQEVLEQKRKELEAKEKKSESLIQKRNEMLHKRTEEQRRSVVYWPDMVIKWWYCQESLLQVLKSLQWCVL